MKAPVLYGALAFCVLACNRPDSALFGPDQPSDEGSGGASGSSPTMGGTVSKGGSAGSSTGGGSPPSGGGTGATGGTEASGGEPSGENGGEATDPGAAGQAGAAPEVPPEPKCGNGVIEQGEECDDAGKEGRDGCTECKVSCADYGAGAVMSEDHHCYLGFDEADYEMAARDCADRRAHLVTISSAAENDLVRKLVNDSKFIGAWEDVAATAEGQGNYVWVTGEPLSYANWAMREPNREPYLCGEWLYERCYEHCAVMTGQGTWQDRRCDQRDGYVCEWEPPQAAAETFSYSSSARR